MKELLEALRGASLVGRMVEQEGIILHYLIPGGRVLEVILPKR